MSLQGNHTMSLQGNHTMSLQGNHTMSLENDGGVDKCEVVVSNMSTIPCTRWGYHNNHGSAVAEFNLVCGNKFWIYLSQTIYLLGYVVGTFTSGVVADMFGRKPTIIAASFLAFIFSSAAAFSPSIIIFNLCRFLTAASSISLYYVSYTYCLEFVSDARKSFVTVIYGYTVSIGYALVPLLSWAFPYWANLQLVGSLPLLVVLAPVSVPSFFSESPRWLLANECKEESDSNNSLSPKSNASDSSIRTLFRSPGICFSTILLLYIWIVFIIIYNFIIMNAKNIIPGDADLNIVIMAALDVGAGFATFPLVQYCGRRISTSMCLFITGSSFVFSSSVSNLLVKQVFAQLGQFVNTICFNLMYVFSAEIYPTVVRSRAMGLLGCSGRIGCLLPPLLLPFVTDGEYFLALGLMTLLASAFIWMLPETKEVEMMDTLEDGENFNAEVGGLRLRKKVWSNNKNENTS